MIQLAVKSIAMLTLIGLSFIAITLAPVDQGSYLASVIDKQARLQATESPKLVLVGGSNLSFGVDSPRLERELGYPVVNMGLGINAGLRFILDSVIPFINEGDIVILMPEYHLFYGLYEGDDELLDVLEAYPPGLRYIHSLRQLYNIARELPMHAKLKFNRMLRSIGREPDTECLYCRKALNAHGDLMAHLGMKGKDLSDMQLFRRKISKQVDVNAVKGLNRFIERAQSRGARVFFMYASIPRKQYGENKEKIEAVASILSRDLEAPILGTPQDHTYDLKYFFDWIYHLNGEGRELRTTQIIAWMREALKK